MKMDRRGDIGFMEAMAGTMTVCIVLLGFTAFLAADIAESDKPMEFDWTCLNDIIVSDGTYNADAVQLMQFAEKSDYIGISVDIRSIAETDVSPYHFEYGNFSKETSIERRLLSISTDDGQCIPTVAEVTLCR